MKPHELKLTNRLNALRSLHIMPRSRTDLARSLKLSKATITFIVDQLLAESLIFESGTADAGEQGGKKPIICAINPGFGYILALHYDYLSYQIALADMGGTILAHVTDKVTFHDDYRKTFDVMLAGIRDFLAANSSLTDSAPILACGIASTGLVDSQKGILQYAATQKTWRDVPLRDYFAKHLDIPVFVEHDARVLTYIDRFAQQDGDNDIYASIFIGAGVAAGVIIGNSVIHGAHYGAVNFPHTVVDPRGPLCKCGKHGCWESFVSTESLARDMAAGMDKKKLTFRQAVELYHGGNRKAVKIVEERYCYWLGLGLSNFITTFNPLKLTVYGEGELFVPAVREKIMKTVGELSNSVAIKTEIFFDTETELVYMRGVTGMVLRNLLSPKCHHILLKDGSSL